MTAAIERIPARPVPAPWECRWCGATSGDIVLDLGEQPAATGLPGPNDPVPDPVAPLKLVRCVTCNLLQLEAGLVAGEELVATEPMAMREQGYAVVADLLARGWASPGSSFAAYGSPHGTGWEDQLQSAGLVPSLDDAAADLVVDVFGLMHEARQRHALSALAARVRPGGHLVLQVHPFGVDVAAGAWNALRHGHYAYYTVEWLVHALGDLGLNVVDARHDPLQGGTVVLVAGQQEPPWGGAAVLDVLAWERETAPVTMKRLDDLARAVTTSSSILREFLNTCRADGLTVAGYAAGTGVPPLLALAGVGAAEVVAIADMARSKQGRFLPVSRIPVVSPDELVALAPDRVLVFVPMVLDEARAALPVIEERGGRWVTVGDHLSVARPLRPQP